MAQQKNGRTTKIWRDGTLIDWSDAPFHVMSHVVHYGSSVFEGMRCYETPAGGAMFRAREHMRRLLDSARIYRIPVTHSLDELVQACSDTVAANELRECYIRPIVVRTGETIGVQSGNAPVEVFIICWVWETYLGEKGRTNGVAVCVSSWRRYDAGNFTVYATAGGHEFYMQ